MSALREPLTQVDKSLIGNKGYRKFLCSSSETSFSIDEVKIQAGAEFDGK